MKDPEAQGSSVLLRPAVQASILVAVLSACVTAFTWKSEIDAQTRVNQLRIADMQASIEEARAENLRSFDEMQLALQRIESKLDQKADKE